MKRWGWSRRVGGDDEGGEEEGGEGVGKGWGGG